MQRTAETTLETVRNPVATSTGLGSGVLLTWLYNDVAAPKFGLPPMPDTVVVVLSPLLLDIIRYFMVKTQVVQVHKVEPAIASVDTIAFDTSAKTS